jgi:hypothetical protein
VAQSESTTPEQVREGAPERAASRIYSSPWWRQAPTRSEALLFGLLILAIVVLLVAPREKTVYVVPAPLQSASVVIT